MEADVLVIGVGAAGCSCALKAADLGLSVALVTSGTAPEKGSNTAWAQGGIIYRSPDDRPELLAQDVHRAGAGICFDPAVRLLAERGPAIVEELLIERCGVPFDRRENGALDFTEEAAHSRSRIIHVEDATGRAIAQHLAAEVARHPNIKLVTGAVAVDLIMRGHHTVNPTDVYHRPRCIGAYFYFEEEDVVRPFVARETVLATGGLGQIYLHSTNPPRARGDGLAMAYRAGARVINLEYIQFHPTAFFHRLAPRFLVSESLRGEGARLIDSRGREFMRDYHELGDLAPRDVVARGIHEQMMDSGEECVYLDITHKPGEWIRSRFPLIHSFCREHGIDMTSSPIPVVPAAHYCCGGVAVDLEGRSNVVGLRAVGEASCTGVHGANRLASTSLLEAVTWGYQAAEGIAAERAANQLPSLREVIPWEREEGGEVDPTLIKQDWMTIKMTMWNYVGLVRARRRLTRALKILRELQFEVESFYRRAPVKDSIIGLRNGVQTSIAVTHSAFRNRVSRGGHYRID